MNIRKLIIVAMAGAFVLADANVALAQNQAIPKPVLAYQNLPIPGVDIIVKRKPPRGEALTAVSDASGRFAFKDVAAGQYELSVIPRQTRQVINTTRSNIKHPIASQQDGVEVVTVDAELGGRAVSTIITITADRAVITGTVTRAEAAREVLPAPAERR
ncbi:MAG: carboxypeptidase-like regulatory domain-containing protein [Sphingomicrobium sp.]